MTGYSIWAQLPFGLAGFAAYLAVLAVILRQHWARSPARIAVGCAGLMYLVVVVSTMLLTRGANFWVVSIFFWFPTVVFLMLFGAVYKSISLRILLDLLGRPAHADLRSVLARHMEQESFEKRLEVMLENGFAVLLPDGYALTDKGRRLASGLAALQRLFAIARSG